MLNMIWAQNRTGGIGKNGAIPWHVPEDLRIFKSVTMGETVAMGRKTWDSLPMPYRPLPGRRNIVITRTEREDVETANNYEEILALAETHPVWVIGGGQIYADLLSHATHVVITQIPNSTECDVYAPVLGSDWSLAERFMTFQVATGMNLLTTLHQNERKITHPAILGEYRRRVRNAQRAHENQSPARSKARESLQGQAV